MSWRAFSVELEGARLAGETRGDGPPALALLHGFGSSRAGWDAVVAALPADLPLLRYDLRGFGASEADDAETFSHADDLAALLDALGIGRIALAGISLGGGVAAHFALDRPDRVSRLALICPMLMGWSWSDDWLGRWKAMMRAARGGDMDAARALWWDHPLFAPVRETAMAETLRASIDAFSGKQWLRDPQRPVSAETERLHTLAAPALLLTGERDLPDFRLIADVLEASVPDLRRIDYPGAGHMLTLERPREIASEIAAFVRAG